MHLIMREMEMDNGKEDAVHYAPKYHWGKSLPDTSSDKAATNNFLARIYSHLVNK